MEPPSKREILAAFISRQLVDGSVVVIGTGLPVPRAGVLLAHLTHAPNMTPVIGPFACNLRDSDDVVSFEFFADNRYSRYAESLLTIDEISGQQGLLDAFFVGGLQVDPYGNVNLIGIGKDYHSLKVRGPGPIGTTSITSNCKRYFIYVERHDPRVFVEKCDFVSAVGWLWKGKTRGEWGLFGGPEAIITPLCVFSFDKESRRARLKALLPGVTVDEVVNQTGFKFDRSSYTTVEPPSEEELTVLRSRVDSAGSLRKAEP